MKRHLDLILLARMQRAKNWPVGTLRSLLRGGSLLLIIASFLAYKLTNLSFRFGDGNAYFAMAQALLDGKLVYRDFFLSDPPVLIGLLAIIKALVGQNLIVLQSVPIWLEAVNAGLIFIILRRSKSSLAWAGSLIYLSSFTVLATSDYLTGVQLAITFTLLSLYAIIRQNWWLAGAMIALACLVKMYAAAVVLGVGSCLIYRQQFRDLWRFGIGGAVTSLVVLLPFIILAPVITFQDLILTHFNRPHGIDRSATFGLFFKQEGILALLAGIGIYRTRQFWLGVFAISAAIFFLFYPDLYYTYLDYLVPFLALGTGLLVSQLWSKRSYLTWATAGLISISIYLSFGSYLSGVQPAGRFTNSGEIAQYLRSLPAKPLYGSHELVPLLSLQSGKPIFNNLIDTNGQLFGAGVHDREKISQTAAANGVYLLARITDRPDLGITDYGYQSYFSEEVFKTSCKRLKDFPSSSGQIDNLIAIYDCFTRNTGL